MEIQILKQEYKDAIKDNVFLKAELAAVNKVSTWAVDRWRYNDDQKLTTATNLGIIKKFLSLPEGTVLTEAAANKEKHVSVV